MNRIRPLSCVALALLVAGAAFATPVASPTPMPDGEARTAMFAGHMANIQRLAAEGKLAVAGPFMQNEAGWRGLFIFAVESIDEAKALAETDPVIASGEMVAEYHPWYGSAALMATSELHPRLVPPPAP